jgi:glycosyltransferase involved in cell wall biosynthesis
MQTKMNINNDYKENSIGYYISIIIPAYNEEEGIGKVLDALSKEESLNAAEIIVVDDASTDKTSVVIGNYPNVLLLQHRINKGYGSAIVTGIKAATRDYVIWFDADGQHRVMDLLKVAKNMIENDFDYCIGVRTAESYQDPSRVWGKAILKFAVGVAAKRKISDYNSGLRGFKKKIISNYLPLFPRRFGASTFTSLLMVERNYIGGDVSIFVEQRLGKSSVKILYDGFRTLLIILRLVLLFAPLRFWSSLGVSLILFGGVYGIVKMILLAENRLGFPVFASLVVILGVQALFFGLLSDQISASRIERLETEREGSK